MKHSVFVTSLFAAILLGLPFSLEAQKAPLPTKILEAKTVFLLSQTEFDKHADALYQSVKKLGRWKIVQEPEKADLIFLMNQSEKAGPPLNFGGVYSYPGQIYCNQFPGTRMTNCTSIPGPTIDTRSSIPTTRRIFYLHVLDPKTGVELWTTSGGNHRTHSGDTNELIQNLAKRLGPGCRAAFGRSGSIAWSVGCPEKAEAKQPAVPTVTPKPANDLPLAPPVQQQVEPSAVTFKSSPEGADITVDGKFIGSTPSTVQLAPGEHEVTIQKRESDVRGIAGGEVTDPIYKIWKRTLTVNPGGAITVDATLEKVQ